MEIIAHLSVVFPPKSFLTLSNTVVLGRILLLFLESEVSTKIMSQSEHSTCFTWVNQA